MVSQLRSISNEYKIMTEKQYFLLITSPNQLIQAKVQHDFQSIKLVAIFQLD